MKRILIYGLIIATILSCNQANIEKELIQIDSLRSVIKEVEIGIDQVDLKEIKNANELMSNQIMLIKNLYGDSIEWEKAKIISKYHLVNKFFSKYLNKHSYLKGELIYSHQQLSDLTSDLENNIIPLDSFLTYFDSECKAVDDLVDVIDQEVEKILVQINSFEEFSPKIEAILAEQNAEN